MPVHKWKEAACPIFGTVTARYNPLQNRDAFRFFDPIVGEGAAGTWEHVSNLMHQALADAEIGKGRRRRARLVPDVDRGVRVDRDLASAGIHPGHDSLYRSPIRRDEPAAEEPEGENGTWPA